MERACRSEESLRWGMGVCSPSVAGEGGCAGRVGMASDGALFLKSGELPSGLSSEGRETEGEGGTTVTFRLEPPSEGTSSGLSSVVGGRSRAGVTRICARVDFWADGFREWLCRGEVSLDDAFALLPDRVSFEKKLGAISLSLSSSFYSTLRVRNERLSAIGRGDHWPVTCRGFWRENDLSGCGIRDI